MDASDIFRQGFVPAIPRPSPQQQPPQSQPFYYQPRKPVAPQRRDDDHDADSGRIAHTLTACCRCRQRKTRCDPTLPRCLPCERSGSVCEYYDSAKGRKISRFYVVKLQEKVRQLEAELAHFTEDDIPEDTEDMIRPGGLVRLSETDETLRYLGASSGIAMTRLLMEEAKRFTESQRISELIPDLKSRRMNRLNRMQSLAGINGSISGPGGRKKSYPMISAHPATSLPSRVIGDKLVEVFHSRAQIFTPMLHETVFATQLNEVFAGSTDPYKNFIVHLVMAISLQKLDTQYAGLADSYYLSAMQYFEDCVRPKDLRTLQCLVLIAQYSMLTPLRTNVYHIVGLATRIVQQLAIADEKTIASSYSIDPLTLDMRRRLAWIVLTLELGLAHTMGRPSGFAKGNDLMDVRFFADVDDKYITESGIQPGPPSEKKRVAIHFCKMRLCQAEIRRMLYEKKRVEPRNEDHPWFAQMEKKLKDWLDASPDQPIWCKPWSAGNYHNMIISLFRPSPQIPKPSSKAALKCYESASYVIGLSSEQIKKAAVDITWIFLLNVYMSLNAALWAVSYEEVRKANAKEKVEEMVNVALDIVEQCSERWPGAASATNLYSIFSKACLQSYEPKENHSTPTSGIPPKGLFRPSPLMDSNSPSASENSSGLQGRQPLQPQQQQQQQAPIFNTPQFGYSFGAAEPISAPPFSFDEAPMQSHPQFRSGSIFMNPASTEPMGRRFSYFPPDAPPMMSGGGPPIPEEDTPPASAVVAPQPRNAMAMSPFNPTSPETFMSPPGSNMSVMSPASTLTSLSATPTPVVRHISPMPIGLGVCSSMPPQQQQQIKFEPQTPQTQTSQLPQPGHRQAAPQQIHPPMQLPTNYTLSQAPSPSQPMPLAPPPPPPPQQPLTVSGAPPSVSQHNLPVTTAGTQRPLPSATMSNWFSPPAPFISPYTFGGMGNGGPGTGYISDPATMFSGFGIGSYAPLGGTLGGLNSMPQGPGAGQGMGPGGGQGLGGAMGGPGDMHDPFGFANSGGHPHPERQGSLSQEQQLELMDVLETEGMGEINTFLNMGMGIDGVGPNGEVNWQ